jgi:uncharacterized protein (DUF697 family)
VCMYTRWPAAAGELPEIGSARRTLVTKSPVSITKVVETWRDTLAAAGRSAGVVLGGDEALVALAQQRFAAGGTLPATWARPLAELPSLSSVPGELLVLLLSPRAEVEALAALGLGVPKGGVVVAVDEGDAATGRVTHPFEGCTRLSFSDAGRHWRRLFEVCAETAGDHLVALGRRYPAMRTAAARRVVYRTAAQNALIGATFFVPGADMPAMTLNQARMVLSLAGIYGERVDRERAVELVGLVGVGFGLRALARSFLRSAPGIGWAIKASTGFTGTVAVGLAAMRYFERGAPAATSKVMALVRPLRR